MSKTIALTRVIFSDYLTYRVNFIFWRFRNLISYFALIVLWQALFTSSNEIFAYTKNDMMTYIIGIAFISNGIFGSLAGSLAGQIRNGELTKDLLYPLNIFWRLFIADLVDKGFNITFLIPEVLILGFIFSIVPVIPDDPFRILLFVLYLCISLFLFFFLNVFLSLTAFWTDDVWAVRWLFGVILFDFFSGLYFPLDVLPKWLFNIIQFTPFPYLAYFPMKLWLGDITLQQGVLAIMVSLVWAVIFYFATTRLFKSGIKDYGAYGN